MKKILTFTMSLKQSQWEVERVVEEAKKRGIEVERALYRDIQFSMINDQLSKILVGGEEIGPENTMGVWFRVAGTKSGKYTEGRNLLIRSLRDKIFCCNARGYLNWARMGKIAQHGVFVKEGIPVVPTRIFYTKESTINSIEEMEKEWGWPIIAKHERGYQGKSVRKFDNREEMLKWLGKMDEKNLGMYLWQKFLPGGWDIRVIVIDGKAIGAMKRTARGGEFRSNFSLGGEVEKWELSEEEKELAEKVARVCGLDYGGVDIMKSQKSESLKVESMVLEVNRQCQFQGFEKATGINVAGKVVEMMIKKSRRSES